MDEILNKLLQSELLSEETKAEISEQWQTSLDNFKTQVREEVTGEVRAELGGQWITERDELIRKVDEFVAEALTNEMAEFTGDVQRFRDLEVEFAEKLVEEKHKLAETVAEELDSLVDKIDAFFEMRLTAELDELSEDLQVVKENTFARQIFEAFASTYAKHYVDEDSVHSKLVVAESKAHDLEKQLAKLEENRNTMIREAKMEQVLAPLTGKKREQMAMVLKGVDTSRLEESYKFFIGRILKEDNDAPASKPLNESQSTSRLVTGEKPAAAQPKPANQLSEFKRLAGLK